jgi:hypothetical protein
VKERADRLVALEQEAATEFGIAISDHRAKRVALLRLQSEDFTAAVISGKPYDHDIGLKLDAELRAWTSQLMPPPKAEPFEVIIVGKDGSRKELEERRKEYVAEMKAKEASAPPVPIAPPPAPSPIAAASCRVSQAIHWAR